MLNLIQEAVLLKINKALNNTLEEAISLDKNIENKLHKLNKKIIKIKIYNLPTGIINLINFEYIINIIENKFNIISNSNLNPSLIQPEITPDLNINIAISSLVKLKFKGIENAIRDRDIELNGDLYIAMELQSIFNNIKIDFKSILQENLAKVTSDLFAWQFVWLTEKVLNRINLKHNELKEQIVDYLQTEKNILVNKYEAEQFFKDVDQLRNDVARLEAKLNNAQRIL